MTGPMTIKVHRTIKQPYKGRLQAHRAYINSDVPHGQCAKTLSTLQENMANMAEIMNQIWQRVDSGGKASRATKRRCEELNSSASSSESEQDNQDEHSAKRQCSNPNEDDDTVSVIASEDEVRQLLHDSDHPQRNKESSNLPDDNLLRELEEQFNEDKSLELLAVFWAKMLC